MKNKCKFITHFGKECGLKTDNDNTYCSIHNMYRCSACGEQSTHECNRNHKGFICGGTLCDNKFCNILHLIKVHKIYNIDDILKEYDLNRSEIAMVEKMIKDDDIRTGRYIKVKEED